MVQSLKSQLMERTILEEQRRFVELYLHISKDFQDLKYKPDLLSRITNLCASTISELMPKKVTSETYQRFAQKPKMKRVYGGESIEVSGSTELERLLKERLLADSDVVSHAEGLKSPSEIYCSNLAVTLGEGYTLHLQRQLWPQIKQRHDSALQTRP